MELNCTPFNCAECLYNAKIDNNNDILIVINVVVIVVIVVNIFGFI